MKKPYGKPMISFENFSFSSNIASSCSQWANMHTESMSCSTYATFGDKDSCAFSQNGWVVSSSYTAGCEFITQNGVWANLCYHAPTPETRIFSS